MAKAASFIGFGVSTFGKSLLWVMVEVYGLFSLSDLLNLQSAAASIIFLALLLWSAVTDIAAGHVVDRYLTARSTNRLMRISAIAAGACFAIGFAPLPGAWGAVIALIATILFRPLYSLFDVPHNALLRALDTSAKGRARLSAIRLVSSTLASFTVALLALYSLSSAGAGVSLPAYRTFGWIVAGLGTAAFLATPGFVQNTASDRPAALWHGAGIGWPAIHILGALAAGAIGFSLFFKALPYIAHAQFHVPSWSGNAVIAIATGRILSLPLWHVCAQSYGARRSAIAAFCLCGATALVFLRLATQDLDPTYALVPMGVAMGGVNFFAWILVAELAEIHANENGSIRSSLFGLYTSLSKVALGLGGSALGILLMLPANSAVHVTFIACAGLAGFSAIAALWLRKKTQAGRSSRAIDLSGPRDHRVRNPAPGE